MAVFEIGFILGCLLGFFTGSWVGGRWVLYLMHHDDVESAHSNYKRRKDKYLGKN